MQLLELRRLWMSGPIQMDFEILLSCSSVSCLVSARGKLNPGWDKILWSCTQFCEIDPIMFLPIHQLFFIFSYFLWTGDGSQPVSTRVDASQYLCRKGHGIGRLLILKIGLYTGQNQCFRDFFFSFENLEICRDTMPKAWQKTVRRCHIVWSLYLHCQSGSSEAIDWSPTVQNNCLLVVWGIFKCYINPNVFHLLG